VCWSYAQGPCSFRKSLACSRSEVFRIFADRVPPFGCRASLADKKWLFLALLSKFPEIGRSKIISYLQNRLRVQSLPKSDFETNHPRTFLFSTFQTIFCLPDFFSENR
jgi:hypothetical protein